MCGTFMSRNSICTLQIFCARIATEDARSCPKGMFLIGFPSSKLATSMPASSADFGACKEAQVRAHRTMSSPTVGRTTTPAISDMLFVEAAVQPKPQECISERIVKQEQIADETVPQHIIPQDLVEEIVDSGATHLRDNPGRRADHTTVEQIADILVPQLRETSVEVAPIRLLRDTSEHAAPTPGVSCVTPDP